MKVYHSKFKRSAGTSYKEVYPHALASYKAIKAKTKRQPYVRSKYFKGEKVFLTYFWQHIRQKNFRDRVRRIRFFQAGIDLIEHSTFAPVTKPNPNKRSELLHRFAGLSKDNEIFYVQIKENTRTKRKDFISIFPDN